MIKPLKANENQHYFKVPEHLKQQTSFASTLNVIICWCVDNDIIPVYCAKGGTEALLKWHLCDFAAA